jgi:hypothetical protein
MVAATAVFSSAAASSPKSSTVRLSPHDEVATVVDQVLCDERLAGGEALVGDVGDDEVGLAEELDHVGRVVLVESVGRAHARDRHQHEA